MEIIFNETTIRSSAEQMEKDPNEAVESFRKSLEKLGNFIGADKIKYVDRDKGELYTITKGTETLILKVSGTPIDGGWLNIEVR